MQVHDDCVFREGGRKEIVSASKYLGMSIVLRELCAHKVPLRDALDCAFGYDQMWFVNTLFD